MIPRYTIPQIQEIWSSQHKFELMLGVELLVLEALAKRGVIPPQAVKRIKKNARFNIDNINKREKKTHHDIVAFVFEVCSYLGEDAQYFHWGLTSNDILDTSLGLQLKESLKVIFKDISLLEKEVVKKVKAHKDTLCVGRSHGIHAEPYFLGLKFLLFLDEIRRNRKILENAQDSVSVGKIAGAVGTYAHISPDVEDYVLKKLGLRSAGIVTQVVPRDRFAYLFSSLSVFAACMERFGQELRHLQRTEVSEVFEPFYKGQKGSSAMPHKRNPILCERLCGMARLMRGYLIASLENVSLWHERDISHSSVERVVLPDALHVFAYMVRLATRIVKDMEVDKKRMTDNFNITGGLIFSQALMLLLMEKGLGRQKAYDIVQEIALKSARTKKDFQEEVKKHPVIKKKLTQAEIKTVFSPKKYLKNASKIYGRFGIK